MVNEFTFGKSYNTWDYYAARPVPDRPFHHGQSALVQ